MGFPLSALSLAAGSTSSAAQMATWLNSAANTNVTASAQTIIEVDAENIDFTQQVKINDVLIGNGGLLTSTAALAEAINAKTAQSNVVAKVTYDGKLQITNAAGHEGENITLSNPNGSAIKNALGQINKTYVGQLQLAAAVEIGLTFGASGVPVDLATLGLRTGIYVNGPVTEELAVFVTGTGSAGVAAGFGAPNNEAAKQSLEQPFTIQFSSANQYSIVDDATGTVVATRSYSAGDEIKHKGFVIAFDGNPIAGDVFAVDSNSDGIGDNSNMLKIVALQDKELIDGSRTLSEAYIGLVSVVGSKAALATISRDALQVVYDQAVEAKDQISGVSLDEEAAQLIRFQQAYQASAQIIQVASKLFDSILSIR